ncbi:uncharacterized protein CEXT_382771 [Caerostris extrusa]|uniref:Bcl-2 Bcl-2 homology region 1-3 domain-containing protein n=1 Tax=Caerostris extrusa TaxID=172846 RepID=A0AAV4UG05_CAEEX|nr:uncharacterized protein CEXT_382771 [Caerostris extrusa]
MLDEVFKHGITKHHLVALFFFCSDVLVRCVKAKLRELGLNLFKWSIQYIVDRVCKWIAENGGWEKVIKGTFFIPRKFIYVSAGMIAVAAVCWLSVKGIKK